MTSPDDEVLRRAASALRTERTGQITGSGFTRARILNTVRAQRKRRTRWWRVGFPIGVILAGGTAWASASGKWPEVLATVATLFESSPPALGNAPQPQPQRWVAEHSPPPPAALSPSALVESGPPASPTAELRDIAQASAPAEPIARGTSPQVTSERTRTAERTRARPRAEPPKTLQPMAPDSPSIGVERSIQAATEPPPMPAVEVEIREFRKADDLYRRDGNLEQAITAYQAYMRDYPTGRFVPEARYNTALASLKLGRNAEAKRLLQPFADGTYGTYRKAAAQKLLDALNSSN